MVGEILYMLMRTKEVKHDTTKVGYKMDFLFVPSSIRTILEEENIYSTIVDAPKNMGKSPINSSPTVPELLPHPKSLFVVSSRALARKGNCKIGDRGFYE